MGSVLVIRNPAGRQFTDLASLSFVGGIAWGECFLQLCPLLFDDLTMESARGFGRSYIGTSSQSKYDQYCRLSSEFREEIEGYADGITKQVKGISIGVSVGGSLGELGDVITRGARIGVVWLQRFLVQRFSRFIRQRAVELVEDGLGSATSGFTTGTSGGFFNMYDGGALHGMNGNDTLDLEIERIYRMNFAVIQLGGGVIVGAGINLLMIGDFPSINTIIERRGTGSHFEIDTHLMAYLTSLFSSGYCYAFIGDAAIGAILPGVDLNIVAS
ncbi:MAG: hypothetical protein E6Q58_00955 [Niabella sp.]|nr:MAG: hypothetical protein E6Q58_00955 [Niabella sp.]